MSNTTLANPTGRIELKLRKVSQLFHTLDPSPFRESDLALEAEEYIVNSAQELPRTALIEISVHVPSDEFSDRSACDVADAIKGYFGLRSRAVSRELEALFREGRVSALIGLIVLSLCLLSAWFIGRSLKEGPLTQILQESLVIFGWVAIWQPSNIFLYNWLPLARRRKLFRRLAEATVKVDGDAPRSA
jgi:hypothetical protein